jgi:diguanylate cyclase (GGDEF)-like protein
MPVASGLRKLARVLGGDTNTYEGVDRVNAARLVAILAALSGLLTLAYLAFDPPTHAIGSAGWAIAGAVTVAQVACGAVLLRDRWRPGFNELLALSYLGLASVALMVWLAGGTGTPYESLYLLWLGSAVGVHPPRRALTFLAFTAVAASLPLAYDGWDSAAGSDIATSFLMWAAIAALLMLLMISIRAQRIRLRAEEARAQQLARADSLTGLGNRRAFDEALTAEMARARRVASTVSVALVDVDGFKKLNDRFGHLQGDRCLREVAAAITDSTRGGDRAFRWGGDEIVVLFPDTDHEGAREIMIRMAQRVEGTVAGPEGWKVTISWGAAELTEAMSAADLLSAADGVLMAGKRGSAGVRSDTRTPLPSPGIESSAEHV